jgi:hypothetical protein
MPRKIGHCAAGVKIPQEEADDEVVLVGVVINTFQTSQRPTTPPPESPVCVISQVWGNHVDGMVAPPAASPGVPPMQPKNSPRDDIYIVVILLQF